jgi:hypothetical protein
MWSILTNPKKLIFQTRPRLGTSQKRGAGLRADAPTDDLAKGAERARLSEPGQMAVPFLSY